MNDTYINLLNEYVEKIRKCQNKTIFLVGNIGTGKTTILNKFIDDYSGDLIIDVSSSIGDYIEIENETLFEINSTCIFCDKIIDSIKNNHNEIYNIVFSTFEKKIYTIKKGVRDAANTKMYDSLDKFLPQEVLSNPIGLIDEIMDLINKIYYNKKIYFTIDNFDKVGYTSKKYQKFIFKILNKYYTMIVSVSDVEGFKLIEDKLEKDNDIILVNYSQNPHIVQSIIKNKIKDSYGVNINIALDTINKMIKLSHGDLQLMLFSVESLLKHGPKFFKSAHEEYLLKYIYSTTHPKVIIPKLLPEERTLYVR